MSRPPGKNQTFNYVLITSYTPHSSLLMYNDNETQVFLPQSRTPLHHGLWSIMAQVYKGSTGVDSIQCPNVLNVHLQIDVKLIRAQYLEVYGPMMRQSRYSPLVDQD